MHGDVPNAPYLCAEMALLWSIYRNKYYSAPLPWWVFPSLILCCGAYSIFAVGLMAPKGSAAPRGPSSASWVLLHLCIHNTGSVIGFISYMDITYVWAAIISGTEGILNVVGYLTAQQLAQWEWYRLQQATQDAGIFSGFIWLGL